jgi:hypothetical protein
MFDAWYMLWGGLAVGIPIAIHFFFRSRYRVVPWAAIKFLLASIEQTSRRLKFQELLLLILRCTVLALLALAFAQPRLGETAASGNEPAHAVFVFDTSFSMGAREGKQTRLDFARKKALAVLDRLPPNSTVQVVACADRARLLGPAEPEDLEQARTLIERLELTHLATDLAPGVREAESALARVKMGNKELYVFSDMQRLGWEQNRGPLARTLKDLDAKGTRVFLVHCAEQPPRNVAVVGIAPQSGIPRPGERVGFAVMVRNTGSVPLQDLKVALRLGGDERGQEVRPVESLSPGETRAVPLTVKLGKAGLHVLTASVQQDDLDEDNQFFQVIQVRERVRVLVVDGARDEREPPRSSAFTVEHAILPTAEGQPAKFHIALTPRTPRRVSADDLRRHDICVLVNVALERRDGVEAPPGDFVKRLGDFVRKGKGLLVFGGPNVEPEAYNRTLGKDLGLLPVNLGKELTKFPDDAPGQLDRQSIDAPSLLHFREDEDYKGLSFLPILRSLTLEEPAKDAKGQEVARVLMRYANGKPALAARRVGAGEVLLFATSAGPEWQPGTRQPTWNYLYAWPGYVPVVQGLLNHLLHRQTQNHNFTAGETLRWHPGEGPAAEAEAPAAEAPKEDRRSFVLIRPPARPKAEGEQVPLGRAQKEPQGLPVVTASGLHRAGVYYLKVVQPAQSGRPGEPARPAAGKEPPLVPFAVVPDLRESANLETLTEAQLNELLGFRPVHVLRSGATVNTAEVIDRTNYWTVWLLLAVLALAMGECFLAWQCDRAK